MTLKLVKTGVHLEISVCSRINWLKSRYLSLCCQPLTARLFWEDCRYCY